MNYEKYNEFEKHIGPIEEAEIRAQFRDVIAGNGDLGSRSCAEQLDAFWLFRHGWICCRLKLTEVVAS